MGIIESYEKYELDEIIKHNIKNDLWIIINKKVYNITSFVKRHPGDEKMFIRHTGEDLNKSFKMFKREHNTKRVKLLMESLCIGILK